MLGTDDVPVPIPDEPTTCADCGGDTKHEALPDVITQRIEYVPGRFVRRRYKREKIVVECTCPGTKIIVAPPPPPPIAGGMYGARFIAFLIVEKAADSIPIYRVEKRFARLGIAISRSTMNDLVLAAAERLRPLFARIAARIKQILGASEGTLVVDGYTGYNVVTDPTARKRGGCMCHGRRKIYEARATAPDEAEHAIGLKRKLFRVEAPGVCPGGGFSARRGRRRIRVHGALDRRAGWPGMGLALRERTEDRDRSSISASAPSSAPRSARAHRRPCARRTAPRSARTRSV